MATGKYFKWAAHDDVCLPNLLEECVRVLDEDPSVVLSYSRALMIDASGKVLRQLDFREDFTSPVPALRYREALVEPQEGLIVAFYGLIRSDILRKTPLLGNYSGADLPLVAELTLHGRFHLIPDFLFFIGHRGNRSPKRPQEAAAWFDPNQSGKLLLPA